jgi:hypothetical protein
VISVDLGPTRELIESVVTALSILGGTMACSSGYSASRTMSEGRSADMLSRRVNEGLGNGFSAGWPLGTIAFIIFI